MGIPRRVWLLLTHQFCKDHDQSFKMKPVKEIEALLKNIDLNGDGFLTPVEFRASIMENFGEDYEPDSDDEDFFELLGSFADDDDRVKIKKVTDFLKIMKSLENCESKKDTLKVVKNCSSFSMRMETESFLKLKPRLVSEDWMLGRVKWKMSLK